MTPLLTRLVISPQNSCFRITSRLFFVPPTPVIKGRYGNDQMEFIKSEVSNNSELEWTNLRKKTLELTGSINNKNFEAVLLKLLVSERKFDAALSFAEYVKQSSDTLSLGAINGLLIVYYEMGRENELSEEPKTFILNSYNDLYSKYKVLDSTTCERLIHALCVINEWKKAMKVLDDIDQSSKPSHSAFSIIIATLFKVNKKTEALKMIRRSVQADRPLQHIAYLEWVNYILRKYKEQKTKLKYLNEILTHICDNSVTMNEKTAQLLQETFNNLGWNAQFTSIRKKDGMCMCCNQHLECLKATDEEFIQLQSNIKEKLIVGSDLFLKTSPDELDRFLQFVKKTAPYDIVLDALNISYVGRNGSIDRLMMLNFVINFFKARDKKILLIGRKHMLTWPRKQMQQIMSNAKCFFTDDLTQDDPYFITAAILSGPHTDFMSKDLLRGHKFLLKDENLLRIFRRWQWQHQWMVFINKSRRIIVQPPLPFSPCAQAARGWHAPVERAAGAAQLNDGTPDLARWLCIAPQAPI